MAKIMIAVPLVVFFLNAVCCWDTSDENLYTLFEKYGDDAEDFVELLLEKLKEHVKLIFPGTKWCGPGNDAESDEDLGSSKETDACCRAHDHCPDTIPAGNSKHNITNTLFYTRLHCSCDGKFHQCLKKVNSDSSNIIGNIYFNLLGTKCFKSDYPIAGCKQRGGFLNKKCLEYSFDYNEPKIYQWFDEPQY